MPRDRRRMDYMRDRAERRMSRGGRGRDRGYYPMGEYDYDSERSRSRSSSMRGSRRGDERYDMDYEQRREYDRNYDYDMRGDYGDYRGDYARRGVGRPREYDRRDYADDDLDEEYEQDLHKWIEKLKKKDRFGQPKEQVIQKAKEMRVDFKDYTEDEFYAVYLMQVSDYPSISNDPRMYMNMAKQWLEDDDIAVDPSEKVCKYLYEIVLDED